jgi:hypothetical protein
MSELFSDAINKPDGPPAELLPLQKAGLVMNKLLGTSASRPRD